METLMSFISSVGFPIFMCIIMFVYMNKESERHQQEMSEMKEAINQLKEAINEMINILKKE